MFNFPLLCFLTVYAIDEYLQEYNFTFFISFKCCVPVGFCECLFCPYLLVKLTNLVNFCKRCADDEIIERETL